ncbi:uncharacterized protein LOC118430736 [Branchiostoma floridae]|uniref:Uncharacterized protein LOC118430736 n=1 Tax=Branchiostoma floridae TaxID=7739 RepID=A0A9J7NAZ2_BRAFL|nr:uncharacterized protein LOC118430736 [Branchiostoma floridae]
MSAISRTDNPMERGDSENLAIILQDMVRKFESQTAELQALKAQLQEQERRQANQEPPRDIREDSPSPGHARQRRRVRRKSSIPSTCRDAVRKVYRAMEEGEGDFQGFRLTERMDSAANQHIVKTLRDEVMKEHGGPEKCPFSSAELKDAAKRYYRSKRDDQVRAQKGTYAEHRHSVKRNGRQQQKLARRRKAYNLARDSWSEKSRTRAEETLHKDFMSSESSDSEVEGPKTFKVRKLAWESGKMTKIKESLDAVVPLRGSPRIPSRELSDRKVPEGTPEWAISKRYQNGRAPATDVSELRLELDSE